MQSDCALSYQLMLDHQPIQVNLRLSLEIPDTEGSDLSISLPLTIAVGDPLDSPFANDLRNAIHHSIARLDHPLPEGGIAIAILALDVEPISTQEQISKIILSLITETVGAMLRTYHQEPTLESVGS